MRLRVIVVGNSNCGKSSIINRYVNHRFCDLHELTIGVEYLCKHVTVDDKKIHLQIWDCAGHDTFKSITRNYFKNCSIALCVFDLSNQDSLKSVVSHIRDSRQYCEDYATIVLIGNKSDLNNHVSEEDIEYVCEEYNVCYFEVSAKLNRNVSEMFEAVIKKVLYKIQKGVFDPDKPLRVCTVSPVAQNPVHTECCILS